MLVNFTFAYLGICTGSRCGWRPHRCCISCLITMTWLVTSSSRTRGRHTKLPQVSNKAVRSHTRRACVNHRPWCKQQSFFFLNRRTLLAYMEAMLGGVRWHIGVYLDHVGPTCSSLLPLLFFFNNHFF